MFFTDRMMLRALDLETDQKAVQLWLNDVTYLSALAIDAPRPTSRDGVKAWIEGLIKDTNRLPFFAVCERPSPDAMPRALSTTDDLFLADGKARYPIIGLLIILQPRFSFTNRVVHLGILLDEAHQGKILNSHLYPRRRPVQADLCISKDKGFGTEVMKWSCDYMFNTLGLHRCELIVLAENVRAWKCYEKVGFKQEGRQRKVYFHQGQWKDIIQMALLEEEWFAAQEQIKA